MREVGKKSRMGGESEGGEERWDNWGPGEKGRHATDTKTMCLLPISRRTR